jgi:hypothetical protein
MTQLFAMDSLFPQAHSVLRLLEPSDSTQRMNPMFLGVFCDFRDDLKRSEKGNWRERGIHIRP